MKESLLGLVLVETAEVSETSKAPVAAGPTQDHGFWGEHRRVLADRSEDDLLEEDVFKFH